MTGSYSGFGVYADQSARKPTGPRRNKGPLVLTLVTVLVIATLAITAWLAGWFRFSDVLDSGSVESGVVDVLQNHYGEPDVADASCPGDVSTKVGTEFTCTVTVGGEAKTVNINVINSKPEFEVGAPR